MTGATVNEMDFLGADGGRMAMAFGAGCIGCWGFLKAFVSGPVNKSYEKRIVALEAENDRCEHRVSQLEVLLFQYGGGQLRQAMQAALSEERVERLEREAGYQTAAPRQIYREDV